MATEKKIIDYYRVKNKSFLFVGPFPPPYGGVSSHLADLAKSFVPAGCDFHVLQFQGKDAADKNVDGAIVHKQSSHFSLTLLSFLFSRPFKSTQVFLLFLFNVWRSPRLYVSSLFRAMRVAKLANQVNADVVSVYTTKAGALIPFLRILKPSQTIFYCIYADPYKNPKFYSEHRSWFGRAMLNSNKVFSSSCYCADAVAQFTDKVKPSVIYVGVDTDRFKAADAVESRAKLGLLECPTVLFVGRMEPEMGAANALAVAKYVIDTGANVNFVIAGAKGSLSDKIQTDAEASEGRIICRINVPADDLPVYYNACTVMIAPTLGVHACMGVSIKEAMASSKPSVVSNSGGIPEAIRDGVDGITVSLNNEGQIDNELFSQQLLKLVNDLKRCEELGQNARQRCEDVFSVSATAAKYITLIKDTDG